jgi:hypothetical protein
METRELRAAVRGVMNELDPEGLLRMGAPSDEYDGEVDDFVGVIVRVVEVTEALVRATWAKWFWPAAAEGPRLIELARRLAECKGVGARRVEGRFGERRGLGRRRWSGGG